MHRVSSNITIILKLFFPLLWVTFFGLLTLALWLQDHFSMGTLPIEYVRIGMTIFFVLGSVLLYFSFLQLLRVEMDEHFVYATNYWKTARYPFHQMEKIQEVDFLIFKTIHVALKNKGAFGKKLIFIPSQARFQNFLNEHPNIVENLMDKNTTEH